MGCERIESSERPITFSDNYNIIAGIHLLDTFYEQLQ